MQSSILRPITGSGQDSGNVDEFRGGENFGGRKNFHHTCDCFFLLAAVEFSSAAEFHFRPSSAENSLFLAASTSNSGLVMWIRLLLVRITFSRGFKDLFRGKYVFPGKKKYDFLAAKRATQSKSLNIYPSSSAEPSSWNGSCWRLRKSQPCFARQTSLIDLVQKCNIPRSGMINHDKTDGPNSITTFLKVIPCDLWILIAVKGIVSASNASRSFPTVQLKEQWVQLANSPQWFREEIHCHIRQCDMFQPNHSWCLMLMCFDRARLTGFFANASAPDCPFYG